MSEPPRSLGQCSALQCSAVSAESSWGLGMVGSAVCGLMFVKVYSTVINSFVTGISVKECMILALRGDYLTIFYFLF